jgi:prepilin-type N-terminal cleavage/methylation domain-containing protein
MNKRLAFTLIELLVVIAVIGILSGLIVVSMSGTTNKATIAKAQIFSNSLRNSLMSNIVSEWRLDENTGTSTVDSWGGGNNGTLTGTPIWKTGNDCVYGSCVLFDTSDDCIDFGAGSNLNIQGDITISLWVNPLTYNFSDIAAYLFGNGASNTYGYHVWLYKTGYIQYRTNQSSAQQNSTSLSGYIPQNVWSNIVVTRSGANATIYINGVDRTTTHGTHINPASTALNTLIGKYYGATNYTLNGLIDDVKIYSVVVPTSQLQNYYYSGLNNLLISGRITKEEYLLRAKEVAEIR